MTETFQAFLSPEQADRYAQAKAFAANTIAADASQWEIEQAVSPDAIRALGEAGYLGTLPDEGYGGQGWDFCSYGLLNEAISHASVSLGGLLNVHTMVAMSLQKWGTQEQQQKWLPGLTAGNILGALALTEPEAGSDLAGMHLQMESQGSDLILNGEKQWITFGYIADLILVFGKLDGQPLACLVEAGTPGFSREPIREMLGFRASQLAILRFDNCRVPKANILARPGFALSLVAPFALDIGRISVCWAAVGILRACLEQCGAYVSKRETFGTKLIDQGMIRTLVTQLGVDLQAARWMCLHACQSKDAGSMQAMEAIMAAKYFATRAATQHAAQAVQLMGARGCHERFGISRCYRDAKTLEIIEGSNQIIEMLLGKSLGLQAVRALEEQQAALRQEIQPG